jgi:hypothetical protein
MSALFVHAIALVSSGMPATPAVGLRGHTIGRLCSGPLAAWATAWESADRELRRADLLAHHTIVETVSAAGPCLPVRFGTWLRGQREVAELLDSRQPELLAAIARVRGRRELAVTLLWYDPATAVPREPAAPLPVGAGSGRVYLEDRRQYWRGSVRRRERSEALARQLEQAVGLHGADVQHTLCPSERVALSSALLVPEHQAAAIRDRALHASYALPDVRILVNGPWPPYSFSGIV